MGWNLLSSIPESLARCGQVTLPIEEATSTPLYLDTSGVSLLESGPLLHTGCHFKSFVLLDSLSQAGSVRVAEQNLPKGVFHQSFCHSSGRVVLIHAPLPISTQPECKNSLMRIYSQRLETRNSLFVCGLVLPTAGRSLLVPNPSMDLGHQDSRSKNQKRSECYIISFESCLGRPYGRELFTILFLLAVLIPNKESSEVKPLHKSRNGSKIIQEASIMISHRP